MDDKAGKTEMTEPDNTEPDNRRPDKTMPYRMGDGAIQDTVEKGNVEKGNIDRGNVDRGNVEKGKLPARPKGPNASAIVVGLVAMVLAGLVIAKETMDFHVDWSRLGPGAIVGLGVVMLLIGAIGLVRRQDSDV